MLHYLYADQLHRFPHLRDGMFRDRARQFHERLGWEVSVDDQGFERDAYDALNPIYVIWQGAGGGHGGSMRFLPTTGRTMVNDHFSHLTGGVRIESPLIWECTRFCLAPGAGRVVSAALTLGAGELMKAFHIKHFVGVFDQRMRRIYRLMGVEPAVIGEDGDARNGIGVGLWSMDEAAFAPVLTRVGISRAQSRRWIMESLGKTGTCGDSLLRSEPMNAMQPTAAHG